MLFVLGDHRRVSQDSRCQGQVPIANVILPASDTLFPRLEFARIQTRTNPSWQDWNQFLPKFFKNSEANVEVFERNALDGSEEVVASFSLSSRS